MYLSIDAIVETIDVIIDQCRNLCSTSLNRD